MRTTRTTAIAAVIVAFLLATAPPAPRERAGALPGPITSRQLMSYAERIGLSAEQRRAFESLHDEYRREFRILRDGEIAVFLSEQRAVQGGVPRRAVIDDLLAQRDRIEAKIKALDNALFARLAPMLSDEQQARVPRVRLARERARYEPTLTASSFGRRTVELGEVLATLDVAPDDLAVADAIVGPYERRMTQLMRRRSRALTEMTAELMEGLEAQGYVDITQEQIVADAELLRGLLSTMETLYAEANEESLELATDIRELNASTCRRLMATIPPEPARRLRWTYLRQTHPQLGTILGRAEQSWITAAADQEGLTGAQRDLLVATGMDFDRKTDQLLDEGAETMEDFWANITPFGSNQEAANDLRATLADLDGKSRDLADRADAQLEEALGAELVARIRKDAHEARAASEETVASAAAPEAERSDAAFVWSGDLFLPSRITERNVRAYVEDLGLDESLLATLHADYVARFEAVPVIAELRALKDENRDAEGMEAEARIDLVERLAELRRLAVEAIRLTDESLFDDLAALAPEDRRPDVDRFRRHRLRQIYTGSANRQLALGRDHSSEAAVDVAALAFQHVGAEADIARIDAILADYEVAAIAAFRGRLEAQLDVQRLSDRWGIEIEEAAGEDLVEVVALQQRYRDVMAAPTGRVASANQAIVDLNRAALSDVVAALPAEPGTALRLAYDRAAFPSIFDDPAAVGGHLTRARALEDLTPTQRDELSELAATYRPGYERLSRAMVDSIGPELTNVVGLDPEAFKVWQERQQELDRLRYERNELSARAISRLGAILGEDQVRRIGGLPRPPADSDESIFR